jgi:hypothetical protein
MKTLAEAKAEVEAGRDDGIACPCCDQLCKVYVRKLHTEMALFLIKLVRMWREGGDDTKMYHIRDLIRAETKASTDGAYLVHWSLLVRSTPQESKTRGGLYRPTGRGVEFVDDKITVPSHAKIYLNKLVGLTGKPTTIRDALGSKFDYEELMNTTPGRLLDL